MTMVYMKMTLFLTLLAIVSLYLSGWSFMRRGRVAGALEFSLFLLSVALYDFGYAIELNCDTLEEIFWALRIQYIGLPSMTAFYFLFALRFVYEKDFSIPIKLPFFLIPMITFILVWSLGNHDLFYKESSVVSSYGVSMLSYTPGVWYPIHFFYLVLLSLAGEVVLFMGLFRFSRKKRKQVLFIFLSGLIPIMTALYTPQRFHYIDIQPFSLATMGIFLSIAIYKHRLLELVPHAREMAVDSIEEFLIVLDHQGKIQDMNASARNSLLFQKIKNEDHLTGKPPFQNFLKELLEITEEKGCAQDYQFQFQNRHFNIKAYAVKASLLESPGFILIIRETTEMVKLMNELEEQAIYDELTGLFNRRQILNLAEREVLLAGRSGTNMGIILFDLDRFKTVNDTYGHLAGDEVLSSVSRALKAEMRASDLIGRYGGEEFVVICPSTDSHTSECIAERLRKCIDALDIDYGGEKISVSASFGVQSGVFQGDESLSDFLDMADKALYSAKREGRNRVVVYKENSF